MKAATLLFTGSLALLLALASCDRTKKQSRETIIKTGETVGQGTTEFIGGVSRGMDKATQSRITISDDLTKKGLKAGKFYIADSAETKPYQLTVYLIFDKNFKEDITVKVFDRQGLEYGRVTRKIEGDKGQGRFYDFGFDRRTTLENKSTFLFEKN